MAQINANEFMDNTRPDILWSAFEPFMPPAGDAACGEYHSTLFDSPERQWAVFNDDPVNPKVDYPAALALCSSCPILTECRQYALDSREEDTFLAGMTASDRRRLFTKRTEVAKRRRQVEVLHRIGAPTPVIAELLGRDPSLVRRDLRALNIDTERLASA